MYATPHYPRIILRMILYVLAALLALLMFASKTLGAPESLEGRYLITRELVTTVVDDPFGPKPGMKVEERWQLKDRGDGMVMLTTPHGSVMGRYTERGARFQFRIPLGGPVSDTTIDLYRSSSGGLYGTQEIIFTTFNTVTGMPMGRGREAWKLRGIEY